MEKYKHSIPFGIIGLGRFGQALATTLAQEGYDVIVVDSHEDKIQEIQNLVSQAFVVPHITKTALEDAGIQNCHTVIVCVGEDMEVSILSTLNALDLGVERVISKAISPEHGTVLKRIGADVVFPERDSAVRLAKSLTSSKIMHSIDISEEYDICEMEVPRKLAGKTVGQLDLRNRMGLNLIAITNGNDTVIEIHPDTILLEGAKIVVIGRKENIDKLSKLV